ncbi:helix-turn-helix domain-containing protein, partial [Streptomyces sp. NPDC002920]
MSGLWSGQPISLKLDDLDVICVVLGCEIGDLLIPEPGKIRCPGEETEAREATGGTTAAPVVVPKRRDGRSLPPLCRGEVQRWERSATTSRQPPARAVSPGGSSYRADTAAAATPGVRPVRRSWSWPGR